MAVPPWQHSLRGQLQLNLLACSFLHLAKLLRPCSSWLHSRTRWQVQCRLQLRPASGRQAAPAMPQQLERLNDCTTSLVPPETNMQLWQIFEVCQKLPQSWPM